MNERDLQSEIKTLKEKRYELESRVNELDNIVESLDEKNKELENDVQEYKKLYELSKSPAEYEKLEEENAKLWIFEDFYKKAQKYCNYSLKEIEHIINKEMKKIEEINMDVN